MVFLHNANLGFVRKGNYILFLNRDESYEIEICAVGV